MGQGRNQNSGRDMSKSMGEPQLEEARVAKETTLTITSLAGGQSRRGESIIEASNSGDVTQA